MKRFGAHFLGGSTGLEKSQLGFSPELLSSGPLPKAGHPKVQLAGQNPCAVPGATPLAGAKRQTCTGSVWFICSRMSWILLRIFFWWPAKVTPILSRSLETEKKKKNGTQYLPLYPLRRAQPELLPRACTLRGTLTLQSSGPPGQRRQNPHRRSSLYTSPS